MPTNKTTTASEPRSVFQQPTIGVDDRWGDGLELDSQEIELIETIFRKGVSDGSAPIIASFDLNDRGMVAAARRLSKRTITFRWMRILARTVHWVTAPVLTLVAEMMIDEAAENEDDKEELKYYVTIAMGPAVRDLLLRRMAWEGRSGPYYGRGSGGTGLLEVEVLERTEQDF